MPDEVRNTQRLSGIAQELRDRFQENLDEPIPDDIMQVLNKLDPEVEDMQDGLEANQTKK